MSFLKKVKDVAEVGVLGIPPGGFPHHDTKLLKEGILGQGRILSIEPTSMTYSSGNMPRERQCEVAITVRLDREEPFEATATVMIPEISLSEYGEDRLVAVRVDPNDRTRVGVDLDADVPVITVAPAPGVLTASEILAKGEDCTAVITASEPMYLRNEAGVDIYVLTLTMKPSGRTVYQVSVGNPVPPEAMPLLYPGSTVPAKLLPGDDIAIDWVAALASPD